MQKKIKKIVLVAVFCLLTTIFNSKIYALSLTDAQKDYLLENYEGAVSKAKRLRETDKVLFFIGLAHIKLGDYERARVYLRQLIRKFPDSPLYSFGLVKIADTYFFEKDRENAKKLYLEAQKRCPGLDSEPLVLLRLAQIASRKGEWSEMKKYIANLKRKYPNSPENKFSKVLESYDNFFTIQIGAFSEKGNALSLRETLKNDYQVYIVEEKNKNFTIHKVRVGKFKKRYDVEKTAAQLRNQGYPAKIYP